MKRFFRGKGCLYTSLVVLVVIVVAVLGFVGFRLLKLRGLCIENTVPLSQAMEACALPNPILIPAHQSEIGKKLIDRLTALSETPARVVALSEHETRDLLGFVLSRSLPKVTTAPSSSTEMMGRFLNEWFDNTLANVTISADVIAVCAVSRVRSSLISGCPLADDRAILIEAKVVPSAERPGLPFKLVDVLLQKEKFEPSDLVSVQLGLYAALAQNDAPTDSSLLQTLVKKIERITIQNGSLTLYPKSLSSEVERPQ